MQEYRQNRSDPTDAVGFGIRNDCSMISFAIVKQHEHSMQQKNVLSKIEIERMVNPISVRRSLEKFQHAKSDSMDDFFESLHRLFQQNCNRQHYAIVTLPIQRDKN